MLSLLLDLVKYLFYLYDALQEMTTGQDVLEKVFQHLNLLETAYFGLRYLDSTNQTVSSLLFFCIARTRKVIRVAVTNYLKI